MPDIATVNVFIFTPFSGQGIASRDISASRVLIAVNNTVSIFSLGALAAVLKLSASTQR